MIEHKDYLIAQAQRIDDINTQLRALNADKSDIFKATKETVGAKDCKAWKEAVKLREKRRVNRSELEEHESAVADMLHMLECHHINQPQETAVAPVSASANGLVRAPTRARTEFTDPDTGEVITLEHGAVVNDSLEGVAA